MLQFRHRFITPVRGLTAKALIVLTLLSAFTAGSVRLQAQATINTTTLASAVSSSQNTVSVASASTLAVGQILYVDKEAMLITSINGVQIGVNRGVNATLGSAHASGATVYTGPTSQFSAQEVAGACTATNEVALPRIVLPSGNMYQCTEGSWRVYRRGGVRDFSPMLGGVTGTTYTVAGAIAPQPGLVFINGTTLAMTIVNPTTEQNGMIMIIESTNASAHTLTYTAGFNGGTTARDVGTFGGAIGDNIVIIAFNGVWWVISTRNVTLA